MLYTVEYGLFLFGIVGLTGSYGSLPLASTTREHLIADRRERSIQGHSVQVCPFWRCDLSLVV